MGALRITFCDNRSGSKFDDAWTVVGCGHPIACVFDCIMQMAGLQTFHRLIIAAFYYAGQKQAVKAVFFGMAFMSPGLYLLEIGSPEDMTS